MPAPATARYGIRHRRSGGGLLVLVADLCPACHADQVAGGARLEGPFAGIPDHPIVGFQPGPCTFCSGAPFVRVVDRSGPGRHGPVGAPVTGGRS